jgi:hypothetical protein
MISRVTYPTVQRGMKGLSMFSLICMVITAPMKNDISNTIPIEFTPSCSISLMYWRKNIRIRSGRAKTRPISIMYFPTVLSALIMTRKYLSANVHYFSLFLLHLRQFHHRLRRMAQNLFAKRDSTAVICGRNNKLVDRYEFV